MAVETASRDAEPMSAGGRLVTARGVRRTAWLVFPTACGLAEPWSLSLTGDHRALLRLHRWHVSRQSPVVSPLAIRSRRYSCCALLVRLINVALLDGNDSFCGAGRVRLLGARRRRSRDLRASGRHLVAITDRMPLYPLLLAAFRSMFGDAPRAVAFLQAVIDAGTCALIAALGALISPRVGLIAGILAAFSATLIVFSSQILTDTLFLFFFALMLLAGARFLLRPSNGLAALAGPCGRTRARHAPADRTAAARRLPLIFLAACVHRRGFAPRAPAASYCSRSQPRRRSRRCCCATSIHYGSFSLTAQTGDHLAFWIVPLVTQRADGTPYQPRSTAWKRSITADDAGASSALHRADADPSCRRR